MINYNCSITIYNTESRNEYGEPSFDTGYMTKARVVEKSVEIINERGEKVLSDLVVHIPLKRTSIVVGSKILTSGKTYLVLSVDKPKNEVGHFRDIKLICKKYE